MTIEEIKSFITEVSVLNKQDKDKMYSIYGPEVISDLVTKLEIAIVALETFAAGREYGMNLLTRQSDEDFAKDALKKIGRYETKTHHKIAKKNKSTSLGK